MEETAMLHDHEERISKLEQGQEAIKQQMNDLSRQVADGNTKIEQDNKFLREQNQNMIEKLVGINNKMHERKHELRLIDKQNFWKLTLAIGGSAGALYSVIQALLQYLAK
ncbi:hypothetical protein AB1K91_05370 [Terribacillus sp. 179-K 1B1 HS]|uniref:hypothetical protein n=1 Tax=Terribacillus sp. 179-K 1B1 HS TaxID=3142388 RepID=UPI00399F3403